MGSEGFERPSVTRAERPGFSGKMAHKEPQAPLGPLFGRLVVGSKAAVQDFHPAAHQIEVRGQNTKAHQQRNRD